MKKDVTETEKTIREISGRLKEYSEKIDRIADRLVEYEDFSYAADAIQEVLNLVMNLRLDLLVKRPVREYERIIKHYENILHKMNG